MASTHFPTSPPPPPPPPPLTITSPVGGSVVNVTDADIVVPVAQWTGNWDGRPAETTMTDGGGYTSYRVFVIDPKWSFKIYLDSTDAAVAAGFFQGQVITAAFTLGALGTVDSVSGTTVFSVGRELGADGQTPVAVTVSGGGGVLTLNTSL